ncbi:MAG: hypothetical protein COB41_01900 [Proteobacteria bacterium]|nr:MAG: hypothetical protein COB41_01900 [Pseudomonadota bacterium]
MIAENAKKTEKSDVRRIRFSSDFQGKIAAATPHLQGNFSGQVKYLVKLGVDKRANHATPELVNRFTDEVHGLAIQLSRIGNNINQIAAHLNSGEVGDYKQWQIEYEKLDKELGLVRALVEQIHA